MLPSLGDLVFWRRRCVPQHVKLVQFVRIELRIHFESLASALPAEQLHLNPSIFT